MEVRSNYKNIILNMLSLLEGSFLFYHLKKWKKRFANLTK